MKRKGRQIWKKKKQKANKKNMLRKLKLNFQSAQY
jgi:hypothetical protein